MGGDNRELTFQQTDTMDTNQDTNNNGNGRKRKPNGISIMDPAYFNEPDGLNGMSTETVNNPVVTTTLSPYSVYDTVKSRVSMVSRASMGRVVVNIARKPKTPPPSAKSFCVNFPYVYIYIYLL